MCHRGEESLSPVSQYKNWEDQVARQVKKGFRGFFGRVKDSLGRLWALGRQNFTIMLIPHSERKIINFKISVFALTFLGILALAVVGAFLWYSSSYTGINRLLAQKSDHLESAQTNLDLVREEVAQLRTATRSFEDTLNSTMGVVGVAPPASAQATQVRGDLASLAGFQQAEQGAVREVGELKNLRDYLNTTSVPLAQISNVLASQKSLLVDIPTLWPLKDVRGWITTPFGPAIHPFTGQWYLHKGIDIAQRMGTPVVATANGKISKVDYEALGYGHYVDIKHNYGFSTRYGHLSRSYVTKGQDVVRGQVIAALGASGLATGPHLHYEVRIGTEVVDPSKYLNFSSNLFDKDTTQ
jgi:murein DD-endopeptidase MepM/ murein hydrolase activator NlpD